MLHRNLPLAWLHCVRLLSKGPASLAVLWRARVAEIGAVLGVQDTDGIKRKLGPKWAYRFRDTIASAYEEDWQLLLHGLGPNLGVRFRD